MSRRVLDISTIEFWAEASSDTLKALPVSERMELIRLITKQIFNETAQTDRTQTASPSPHDFPEEYKALTNLAKSFSHSARFKQLIVRASDWTVAKIEDNHKLLSALRVWRALPTQMRQSCLKRIVHHFIVASETLSGIPFKNPAVEFFCEGKDSDGDVTQGYYTDIAQAPEDSMGLISLNRHKHAYFHYVCMAAATALHEAVHAVQDQIGVIGIRSPAIVKPYAHDMRLSTALSQHDAIIHHKLDTPYRAQFHERLAFSVDERFYTKLGAVL